MRRLSRLPRLLFFSAALLAAFLVGIGVEAIGIFPSTVVRSAYKTLALNLGLHEDRQARRTLGLRPTARDPRNDPRARGCAGVAADLVEKMRWDLGLRQLRCASARFTPANAVAARIDFLAGDALIEPVLVKGEVGAFLDHCPRWGCLAVEYSRSGAVSRVWPYLPDEFARANIAPETDFPYEHAVGWSFSRGLETFFLSPHPHGDLLVVFELGDSHPVAGGVARVAPDGRPRWYRKDYSHHWPHVVNEDLVLVPGMRLHQARIAFKLYDRQSRSEVQLGSEVKLECDRGLISEDLVNILDGRGELLDEIAILDAIIASPYAGVLVGADDCDPTHTNFAHMLGADAGGAGGIAPGDLVVSLRNLNAFGILDKDDHRLKRLVRGSFHMQHGVRHLDKARFAMFDNYGTDGVFGPSRLLVVDLATGEEITVFPTATTPKHLLPFFQRTRGQFDISADGRRALVVDELDQRAFEIRLADGQVLTMFRQIHNLSNWPGLSATEASQLKEHAWLFKFLGIHYAKGWTP